MSKENNSTVAAFQELAVLKKQLRRARWGEWISRRKARFFADSHRSADARKAIPIASLLRTSQALVLAASAIGGCGVGFIVGHALLGWIGACASIPLFGVIAFFVVARFVFNGSLFSSAVLLQKSEEEFANADKWQATAKRVAELNRRIPSPQATPPRIPSPQAPAIPTPFELRAIREVAEGQVSRNSKVAMTRKCRDCGETIKSRVRRCKYCRSLQPLTPFWHLVKALGLSFGGMAILLGLGCFHAADTHKKYSRNAWEDADWARWEECEEKRWDCNTRGVYFTIFGSCGFLLGVSAAASGTRG